MQQIRSLWWDNHHVTTGLFCANIIEKVGILSDNIRTILCTRVI